ncbi:MULTISPECIES: hypothetical protein [Burkholderia]|uniref:hypothetical protein n=1 Tax=Burkholderia TaxID=32008 RepID=UPI00158B940E|nr:MULTISPECIES: hypothetical protein [Burkholderia]UEP32157.1 hypothetical protein LMA01_23615 [Burkholderia sp. B21-007]UEP45256.1 hypothetical protein LMA02_21165 [Burkholderia sp. B21-005]
MSWGLSMRATWTPIVADTGDMRSLPLTERAGYAANSVLHTDRRDQIGRPRFRIPLVYRCERRSAVNYNGSRANLSMRSGYKNPVFMGHDVRRKGVPTSLARNGIRYLRINVLNEIELVKFRYEFGWHTS